MLLEWAELEPALSRFESSSDELFPCRRLYYEETPADLAAFLRGRSPIEGELSLVPNDQVLSEELIRAAGEVEAVGDEGDWVVSEVPLEPDEG